MHTDEAVNAYIVGQLLGGGIFKYDSQDRHGPALAAVALPLVRIQGAKTFSDLTESELRLASVLAGTATILLFGAAVELFGYLPSIIAALLFAGASLPVYYDRYFIHESLFVASTFGLILAGWLACAKRSAWIASLAGLCAALMLACKETAVLHFFALAAAALCFCVWNRHGKSLGWLRQAKVMALAATTFLLFSVALFTWFGANWSALFTLLRAAPNFVARAAGEGHQKPFWYFAHLLAGNLPGGAICALACLGFFLTLRKRDPSLYGFVAFYAFFFAGIYSLIPYKTPWLALNFWLPIALFCGLAVESIWHIPMKHPSLRIAVQAVCILAGVLIAPLIAHDTAQRAFTHAADDNNPYAYAHTSEDILELSPMIKQVADQNAIVTPRISVIAADPWPLPWYLRHYPHTGFWQPGQQPADADFYITSSEAAEEYRDRLKTFHADFFGVRPGVLIVLWSPVPK